MPDNETEFEAITLSNVWLKTYVLDVIGKINENEIIAYNGSTELVDLLQLSDDEILKMRLKSFDLMRSYILQLLDNTMASIDKGVVLKIKLMFRHIDTHHANKYVHTKFDMLNHLEVYNLTGYFKDALQIMSRAKTLLFIELANKEILMPKKTTGKGEKLEDIELG